MTPPASHVLRFVRALAFVGGGVGVMAAVAREPDPTVDRAAQSAAHCPAHAPTHGAPCSTVGTSCAYPPSACHQTVCMCDRTEPQYGGVAPHPSRTSPNPVWWCSMQACNAGPLLPPALAA
jgi:hypothetical protein